MLAVSTWKMQKVAKTFSHKLLKLGKNTGKSQKTLGIFFVHHSEVEREYSSLYTCERKAKGWDLSPLQSLWITQESSQFLFHRKIRCCYCCFVVVWFCFVFFVKAAACRPFPCFYYFITSYQVDKEQKRPTCLLCLWGQIKTCKARGQKDFKVNLVPTMSEGTTMGTALEESLTSCFSSHFYSPQYSSPQKPETIKTNRKMRKRSTWYHHKESRWKY